MCCSLFYCTADGVVVFMFRKKMKVMIMVFAVFLLFSNSRSLRTKMYSGTVLSLGRGLSVQEAIRDYLAVSGKIAEISEHTYE